MCPRPSTKAKKKMDHAGERRQTESKSSADCPTSPTLLEPPVNKSSTKTRIKKLLRQLHYKYPSIVPCPDHDEVEYFRNRDIEDNKKLRVHCSDELKVRAIWGAEIYGPTEIDSLYLNLEKLGWDTDHMSEREDGPPRWIEKRRMYGTEAWLNIGTVHRPGEKGWLFHSRSAPLPDLVDYLTVCVYQISPSITCLLICFHLTESATNGYEAAINIDFETTKRRIIGQRGYRIYSVEHLKEESLNKIRKRYRELATQWFKLYLPGFFCNLEPNNYLPTCELVTCKSINLLSDSDIQKYGHDSWVHMVIPRGFRNTWKSDTNQCLAVSLDAFDNDLRHHSIIALRTDSIPADHISRYGNPEYFNITYYVSSTIDHLLAHHASVSLLIEGIRILRSTRDTLRTKANTHRQTLSILSDIKRFFDRSIGLPVMIHDLQKISSTEWYFHINTENLTSVPLRKGDPSVKISNHLKSITLHLSNEAMQHDKETREHLQQFSAILNIRESIQAQRRMERLTILAVILAFASLFAALMSVKQFVDKFNHYLGIHQEATSPATPTGALDPNRLTNRSIRTLPPGVTSPTKPSDSSSPTNAPLR